LAALLALTCTRSAIGEVRVGVLDECVSVALREHATVAVADAEVRAATFRTSLAMSGAMPHVAAEYVPMRRKATLGVLLEAPSDTVLGLEDTYTYQVGRFTLTQVLWDFGKTLKLWAAAKADLRGTSAEREAVRQRVVADVKRAYYAVIAGERLLAVAEHAHDRAVLLREISSERVEAGLTARFDLLKQEANVANADLAVVTARHNLVLARDTLAHAMGRPEDTECAPSDPTFEALAEPMDEAQALDLAYRRRPELVAAEERRHAVEERVAALTRDYLPVAIGLAEYSFEGERPESEAWLLGARVRLPVFDGGATAARLGEARAQVIRAEAEEELIRQQVTRDVRDSVLTVRRTNETIRAAATAVRASSETARVAQLRYESGIGSIVELSTSELASFSAKAAHTRILADYHAAVADLERAIGIVETTRSGDEASPGTPEG
jgi:outer membrane protein TolC